MENLLPFDLVQRILLTDFLRYFVAAGTAYLVFWVIFKKRWQHRNIQQKPLKRERMWSEFGYSMSTVLIFSCIGLGIMALKQAGHTLIYKEIGQYGWPWLVGSFGLMVLLHDAYFYWTHRLMHHPKIFRHVHLVHHRSTNPSPWAAYAFHPFEAVLEAGIFPLIVFTIPVHPLVLFIFLINMIARNVQGHLGIEFLPKNFMKNRWLNWNITTTHHDLHHKDFHHNYGFYFTWWDKWCHTEHPAYEETFKEVTTRQAAPEKIRTPFRMAKKVATMLLFMVLAQLPVNAQSPIGTWQTIDDGDGKPRSTVQIEAAGLGLTGKVLDLFPRSCEPPDPVCDRCPGVRKNKPVKGMNILWGFKKKGNEWTAGSILDPANGKTYRCTVWLEDADTLKVRGYWGLFWRTQTWRRVGHND